MNRIVFDLQLFENIFNVDSNTLVSGTADSEQLTNLGNNVTINAGAGNDTIISIGISNVTIDAGAGDDIIENLNVNVTITSGAGNDTISLTESESGTTITDFDLSDKLALNYKPDFAKFADNVLNIDGVKINLPNVKNINDYRNMIVSYYTDSEKNIHEITLGKLLEQ